MAENSALDDFNGTTIQDVAYRSFLADTQYFMSKGMEWHEVVNAMVAALQETV